MTPGAPSLPWYNSSMRACARTTILHHVSLLMLSMKCMRLGALLIPCGVLPSAANFENVGSLTEVAMFHRASRTLLLTDAVIFVPQDAPEVVPQPQLSTAGALPWCALF